MSAKALLPNQCDVLHSIYGRDDCCLCKANAMIQELKWELEALNELLRQRTGIGQGEIDSETEDIKVNLMAKQKKKTNDNK